MTDSPDLFSVYGADKGRKDTIRDWDNVRQKKLNSGVQALSPLEAKMREKQRLGKAFRIWRRNETRRVLASEPRLSGFLRYLRTVQAGSGAELIAALEVCDWLCGAALPVRIFALRMIDARCNKINQQLGNETLDDPIPPDSSVYFDARHLLHAGGRA